MIFLKAQCHWKVFIEKEIIAHMEFVKAKEMEGNGKGRYFSLISTYFSGFCIPDHQIECLIHENISDYFVLTLESQV